MYNYLSRVVWIADIKNSFSHTFRPHMSQFIQIPSAKNPKGYCCPNNWWKQIVWIAGKKAIGDPSIFISLCESLVLTN